jgi:uncharacterized membrane protein YfcA
MGLVALLYGAAGQAGGSGFVAVMTFAHFGAGDIRATAFALNIVAASYATLQLHRAKLANWKLLKPLLVSSVPAAALGGIIPLEGALYYGMTGTVLFGIAGLMIFRPAPAAVERINTATAVGVGSVTGLASGLSGVGGGIFLSSILILLGKASPKDTLALSPPFILANSVASLGGLFAAGQRLPTEALGLSGAVLAGSIIGSAIGLRWMSGKAIRAVLVLILVIGGVQMLIRAASL